VLASALFPEREKHCFERGRSEQELWKGPARTHNGQRKGDRAWGIPCGRGGFTPRATAKIRLEGKREGSKILILSRGGGRLCKRHREREIIKNGGR